MKWLLAILLCLSLPSQALAVLGESDLTYLGAFRVPQGTHGISTFGYGGKGMGYNPINNSLFVVGNASSDETQAIAEISIPQEVNTTTLNDMNTAILIQNFYDPCEGNIDDVNPGHADQKIIGGMLVYDGELYVAVYSYYDAVEGQIASHFIRPLDLSDTGNVEGPYRIGTLYPGFVSTYMTTIPSDAQTAFGSLAITGGCCHAIISIQSLGPAIGTFDPADVSVENPVPSTQLVGYPQSHATLGPWAGPGPNPVYISVTEVSGVAWPPNSDTVLFFGTTGLGTHCYGTGAECGDPDRSAQGVHAYPYTPYAWAYDAMDLLAVKNGTDDYWVPEPDSHWQITFPTDGTDGIGSAAYDPTNSRLYMVQEYADSQYPLIHVWQISSSAATGSNIVISNGVIQ